MWPPRLIGTATGGLLAGVAAAVLAGGPPPDLGLLARPAEGCDRCHDRAEEGPAGLHASFPCEICHGGDTSATTVLGGHAGMEVEGSLLSFSGGTCGLCHQREVERVRASPMATARGLISVDRWAFGEIPQPDGDETLRELLEVSQPTPAQDHLRRLCAGCHLNTRRDNRDDAIPVESGSGCGACHSGPPTPGRHSTVDGHVPDARCFGCHSRSARISLSYQGLAEVSGAPSDACAVDTLLADGRTACLIDDDVHHEAGLECVDCHVHTEIMGDGRSYRHAEQAVEISCQTCHAPLDPGSEDTWWNERDSVTSALLRLRIEWRPDTESVRRGRRGTALWNVRPRRGAPYWELEPKRGGDPIVITPTPDDPDHTLRGHARLSCAACHSASAPTCPTCHTSFDASGEQWDFAAGAETSGQWVERHEGMGSAPPQLGVGADGRIRPAIPGMVADIDVRAAGGVRRDLRLFAVLDPHTTVRASRSCVACHSDPAVYAEGEATRVGGRALSSGELARVLTVGGCLECHDEGESFYADFAESLTTLEPEHPRTRADTLRVSGVSTPSGDEVLQERLQPVEIRVRRRDADGEP